MTAKSVYNLLSGQIEPRARNKIKANFLIDFCFYSKKLGAENLNSRRSNASLEDNYYLAYETSEDECWWRKCINQSTFRVSGSPIQFYLYQHWHS